MRIPKLLGVKKYPYSYRYYDSLISTIKDSYSREQKDKSKLKKSISYAFDQKYGASNLFGMSNDEREEIPKLKSIKKKKKPKNDQKVFMKSPHTAQVQCSNFIQIDEDLLIDQESSD